MLNLENIYTSFILGMKLSKMKESKRFLEASNVSGERKVHAKPVFYKDIYLK